MLVDFDEKTVKYPDLLRQMGHAQRREQCTRSAPPPRSEKPYNVILAVDINVGVLCYVMFRSSVKKEVAYLFIALRLIPSGHPSTGPRFIIRDHLSSHLTGEIHDLLASHGHIIRPRAIHSPNPGFFEWRFSHATAF